MSEQAGKLSRAAEIFEQARGLHGEAQASYLGDACDGDPELLGEIESLLAAHEAQGEFLGNPTHPAMETDAGAPPLEGPGTVIDAYRLLHLIGEGGFGAVYLAEERGRVVRRVALKIIKLGMDTRQVIARFEAERQALAIMDHPNIAKVLGAGATASGRPYFVMELVTGEPITAYCDKNGLSIDERLRLVAQVCHAIQHAHTKGIIHRDIKPSNVLVSTQDGEPFAKVIDFGIAKATHAGARLTDKTLFTEHRALIGTPEYMSPEQAEGSLDIDTRCDVYSLGVLLYELLTGAAPFDGRRLRSAAWDEMLRIIREEDPPKPSTRLSSLSPSPSARRVMGKSETSLAQIAAVRHIEPARLTRLMRGDLDWIVMKCLEKNRSRRYETANGLAQDIERHLSHEPVEAGPPSRVYRMRKFVRRHRAQVTAGGIVAGALVLGVIGTTAGMIWALNEKDRANEEKTRAALAAESEAEAKLRAQENERKAIAEAKRAETIAEFVTTALRAADAEMSGRDGVTAGAGQDMTILAAMDNAIKDIDSGRFKDDLETEARLRATIGTILQNNGRLSEAEAQLRQALETFRRVLGDEHRRTLGSIGNMGILLRVRGRMTEAEPYYREALEKSRRVLGDEHPDTLTSIGNMALLLRAQGKLAESELYIREALEKSRRVRGDEHPGTLALIGNMGDLLRSQGKLTESEPYVREALEKSRRVLGDEHPDTLTLIGYMGQLLWAQGRFDEVEPHYREALDRSRRVLGDEHLATLAAKNNLAALYWSQRKLDQSVPLLEEVLKALEVQLGRQHPNTLHAAANLGVNYKDAGRLTEAIPLLEEAYRASKEHPRLGFAGTALLEAYSKAGDPSKPESLARLTTIMQEMLGEARDTLPKESTDLAAQLASFGLTLLALHAWDEAEPLIREALTIREMNAPDDWTTFNTMSMLGGSLLGQNELPDAEPLLLGGYEGMEQREATIPPQGMVRITEALERLVRLYEAKGDETEAAAWRSKLEAARAEQEKPDATGGER